MNEVKKEGMLHWKNLVKGMVAGIIWILYGLWFFYNTVKGLPEDQIDALLKSVYIPEIGKFFAFGFLLYIGAHIITEILVWFITQFKPNPKYAVPPSELEEKEIDNDDEQVDIEEGNNDNSKN